MNCGSRYGWDTRSRRWGLSQQLAPPPSAGGRSLSSTALPLRNPSMSDQTLVAIVGCIAVLVLMLIRVPIAVSLGSVSLAGFAYLVGPGPAFGILIDSPIRTVTNFNFSVIPMFILMGSIVGASGMSRELFRAANAWLGHLPGGMAIATIFASGGFAAISGSSIAAAATMTKVALPEMRRAGYNPGLAAGIVAAGATLDIMIPP